jgi:hypothetical protein
MGPGSARKLKLQQVRELDLARERERREASEERAKELERYRGMREGSFKAFGRACRLSLYVGDAS